MGGSGRRVWVVSGGESTHRSTRESSRDRNGESGAELAKVLAIGSNAAARESVRRVPTRPGGAGPIPTGPGRAGRRVPRAVLAMVPRLGSRSTLNVVPRLGSRAVPVSVARPGPLAGMRRRRGLLAPARPLPVRPVSAPALAPRRSVSAARGRWRSAAATVLVGVSAAVVVAGLGLLADGARAARVPSLTGSVQVRADESLWQVARRAAPSADPGAVVARIVELNDLGSPTVRGGQVLLSPIE
jgi:hypothetical protein